MLSGKVDIMQGILARDPKFLACCMLASLAHIGVFAAIGLCNIEAVDLVPGARPHGTEPIRLRLSRRAAHGGLAAPQSVSSDIAVAHDVDADAGDSRRAQLPVRHVALAEKAATVFDPFSAYLPRSQVDRPALAKSAPDASAIEGLQASGVPIRLRLYVSVSGEVTEVKVLSAADDDALLVQELRRIFRATGFTPAKRSGQDVASYSDVAVNVFANL